MHKKYFNNSSTPSWSKVDFCVGKCSYVVKCTTYERNRFRQVPGESANILFDWGASYGSKYSPAATSAISSKFGNAYYLLYYKRAFLPGELHLLLSLHNKPTSVIPFWNPYTNAFVVMEPDFPFSVSDPGNGSFSVCSKGCTSRSMLFSPSFYAREAGIFFPPCTYIKQPHFFVFLIKLLLGRWP